MIITLMIILPHQSCKNVPTVPTGWCKFFPAGANFCACDTLLIGPVLEAPTKARSTGAGYNSARALVLVAPVLVTLVLVAPVLVTLVTGSTGASGK